MSTDAQAIWYFIAIVLFIVAALVPLRGDRTIWAVHTGWLGLAAFVFVFFWTAVKAS